MTSLKARLSNAKARLFGTAAKDIVVPFELPCDCGHRVTGLRRTSWQIATCSSCDTRIYVLPVNVYPATKRVRSEVLDGSVANRLSVVVKDLVAGENNSTPDSLIPRKPSAAARLQRHSSPSSTDDIVRSQTDNSDAVEIPAKRSRKSKTQLRAPRAVPAIVTEQILVEEPIVRLPRASMAVVIRRIFTPFRLLMLSAVILIAATGWWMVSQRRMDEARKTWRREMDVAERALDEKDISALHDSLAKAVAAGQVLRRDDAESRRATSLLLQTKALRELSESDLVSAMSTCVDAGGRLDIRKAETATAALSGKWFVFECTLSKFQNGLKADLPLIVNSVPVTVTVDSDVLRSAATALPHTPLLFVASVSVCEAIVGGPEIRIQLNGNSCILVTTEFHAAELGFTAENTPGLVTLLEAQTEFLKSDAVSAGKDEQR